MFVKVEELEQIAQCKLAELKPDARYLVVLDDGYGRVPQETIHRLADQLKAAGLNCVVVDRSLKFYEIKSPAPVPDATGFCEHEAAI